MKILPSISRIAFYGFAITFLLVLNSCASSFSSIAPDRIITFSSEVESDSVRLEYEFRRPKKKYQKKMTKHGIQILAVKIQNNSEKNLKLGDNLFLVDSRGQRLKIMDSVDAHQKIKQKSGFYLLYLLLTPMNVYSTKSTADGVETNTFPAGLIVGPGLAIGNMVVASGANNKFKDELLQYDLSKIDIAPGKTAYGLVCINQTNYSAVNIDVR